MTQRVRSARASKRAHGTRGLGPVALGFALLVLSLPAEAQSAADAGWLPWLGCWTGVGGTGETLCIRPAERPGAVEILTLEEGRVSSTEVLRADGTPRRVSGEGCEGTDSAEFSKDGRRIYLRSDLTCEGGVERRSTGIVAWASPTEWIRVETIEVAGETAATVERYRKARPEEIEGTGLAGIAADRSLAVRSARMAAASRPSTEAVVEASHGVHAEAVRAWVAERGDRLDVDAEKLVRMSEAGVADEVIDVIVAVSFPDRFRLDRGRPTTAGDAAALGTEPRDRYGYGRPYGFPYYGSSFDRWRYGLNPFGWGYSPYGYAGGYGWWYGGRSPTIIVIRPRDETEDDSGRFVNGRGFTRDGAGSRGTARRPSAERLPPSSRGSISPGGARSGGSSGSSGRKAKPKSGGSSGEGGGSSDGGSL